MTWCASEFESTVQDKIRRFHEDNGRPPVVLVVNDHAWRGFKILSSADLAPVEPREGEMFYGLRVITTIRRDMIAEVY